ncbi:MAG TPA: HAMP domain-containing sensor histidine kinase [Thermoanaerobaculia bacterium]|nr:HAMP domain-containing sensor histidine kinase [Thermoanaerobaculia bacterium]
MRPRRHVPVATYVVSLAIAVALLVVWVVYVVRSGSQLQELAGRHGMRAADVPWIVLVTGCVLLFLLIGGLTYQLAQALAAVRTLRSQEEFLANVTHELKSPLAAIKLHAQTLEQPGLPEPARRRSIALVVEQASRMERLVDNVLESSRLVSRKRRLELQPVALGPFLAGYFADVAPRIEARGVRLVPSGGSAATVMATPDALFRVLENLLDNAARHSRPDGEVRCRVTDGAGWTTIEVEDDGVGIPKRELPRVFDRFHRGEAAAGRPASGSGLGLAIVSGLVAEMRGRVEASSQEGRPGARFVLELPHAGSGGDGRRG